MVKRRMFAAAVALSTMFCPATIDAESLPSYDFSYVARQGGSFGSNGGDQLIKITPAKPDAPVDKKVDDKKADDRTSNKKVERKKTPTVREWTWTPTVETRQTYTPPRRKVEQPTIKTQPVEDYTVSETFNPNDTWLIQWYLCGSDLESGDAANSGGAASRDFKELLAVKLPPNVKVLVQTGGAKRWRGDHHSIELPVDVKANQIQRFLVTSNGVQVIQSLPQANMGDPNTLADFLNYGVKNFPADHRVFVFWNHGRNGVGGVCADENYDDDNLDLNDLSAAFAAVFKSPARKPFELVAFDTCVTGAYEYANVVHPYAKYMTASQAVLPGGGLDYTAWVGALAANPALNGKDLGVKICDTCLAGMEARDRENSGFIEKHDAWRTTMSLIDLNQIPALGKAYEDFGNEALDRAKRDPKNFYTNFGRAAMSRNTERYSIYRPKYQDVIIGNQVDLRSFAGEVKRNNVMTKTPDALIAAIDRAVIYNDARGRYKRKGGGISAYHLYESGDLSVYMQQTPAPEPQKKLYDQLSKQHRDVLSRLTREESQQVQSDPTFSNNPKTDKSDSADKTDKTDINKMRDEADRPSEGFSDLMADLLTPEEKAPLIAEYQNIVRDFRKKGLLPADKDFTNLTEEETMRMAESASPEDIARMQNFVYRVEDKYNRKFAWMIKHDYDFDDGTLTLTATVPQEIMDYTTSVQCIVCQAVEDGLPDIGVDGYGAVFLGIGTDVQVDWQKNKFTGKFPTAWPTLNGIPIYIVVTSENADYDDAGNVTGGYNTYIVPIKLNGEDCSLEVAYDFTDNRYYVFGISGGIEESGDYSRESITLKAGDVITPVFRGFFLTDDLNVAVKSVDSNKSFTVTEPLRIENTPLVDGQYAYLFRFRDLQGKGITSKPFTIEIQDGEVEDVDITEPDTTSSPLTTDEQGNITVQTTDEQKEQLKEAVGSRE